LCAVRVRMPCTRSDAPSIGCAGGVRACVTGVSVLQDTRTPTRTHLYSLK
jgi:hypothetical protein